MARTAFFATDKATGERHRWVFWRDARRPAAWVLLTHDGAERTLEANWQESAPRIQAIAENYGCTVTLS